MKFGNLEIACAFTYFIILGNGEISCAFTHVIKLGNHKIVYILCKIK